MKTPRLAILIACALLLLGAQIANADPSFDCERATLASEKIICSDRSISAQDRWLATTYRRVLESTAGEVRAQIVREQADWLRKRDAEGCDALCIGRLYSDRYQELRDFYNAEIADNDPCLMIGMPAITDRACTRQQMVQSDAALERAFQSYLEKNVAHFSAALSRLDEEERAAQMKLHVDAREREFEAWKAWRNAHCHIAVTNAMHGRAARSFGQGCTTAKNEEKTKFFESFDPESGNRYWQ